MYSVKTGVNAFLLWFCAAGLGTLAGNFLIGAAKSESQSFGRKSVAWLLVFSALYLGEKPHVQTIASDFCWAAAMALFVSAERKEGKCPREEE